MEESLFEDPTSILKKTGTRNQIPFPWKNMLLNFGAQLDLFFWIIHAKFCSKKEHCSRLWNGLTLDVELWTILFLSSALGELEKNLQWWRNFTWKHEPEFSPHQTTYSKAMLSMEKSLSAISCWVVKKQRNLHINICKIVLYPWWRIIKKLVADF